MADNTQQIADSLKGINASLESFTNLSKQMEERLSGIADSSLGIRDDFTAIERNQERITKGTKNWGDSLKGVVESSQEIASFLGSAVMVTGIADAFRASLKLDQSMKHLAARMGLGVENSKKLYKSITDVSFATGRSAEDVHDMVHGLIQARVAMDEVGKASEVMLNLSTVTGLVENESMQLYSNLRKVGNLGAKEINQFAVTFAKVQQKVGLTENEMSMLSDSVQETAYRMAAFGQSPAQIEKMSKSIVGLGAQFVKVGLSVQKAIDLVDQLTDPTRIEDNIGLYAQLGISMQDAMSGAIDPKQLDAGLKGFADKVKAMGPIAGAQFAKQMGQNYNDLMKLTKAGNEVGEALDIEGSADPAKEMADMVKAQQGLQMTVEKFFNRINSLIISLGPTILGLAILVTTVILPKIFKTIRKESVDTSETVSQGVRGSLIMGLEKSWVKTSEKIKTIGKNISEDYKKRIVESSDYASAHMSADFLSVQGSINQLKLGKDFAKGAENFTRWLAGSSKPASITSSLIDSMRKRQDEILTISLRDRKAKEEILQTQKNSLQAVIKEKEARQIALEDVIKTGKATAAQKSEYAAIEKFIKKSKNEIEEIKSKTKDLGTNSEIMEKHWKNMSTEHLADISNEMLKQAATLDEQIKQSDIRVKNLEEEKSTIDYLAKRATEELASDKAKLANQDELAKLSIEEVKNIQKRINSNKDILSQQIQLEKELQEEDRIRAEILKNSKEQAEYQQKITDIINDRKENSLGSEGKLHKGFNNILRTFTGELGSNLKANLTNFADKVKNTASTIKDGIATGFKQAAKHPIRTAVQGLGGIAKLAKGIGILSLGMTLFTKALQPLIAMIKENLQPVLDAIMGVLQPIAEKLIKALLPPLLKVLAALLPPLLGLVQIIMKVLTPVIVGIMKLLKFILGWIPGIGDAVSGITDGISEAMKGVNESIQGMDSKGIQKALYTAADGIKNSDATNKKLVEQGEQKAEAAIYNASSTQGFTQIAAGNVPVSSSQQTVEKQKVAASTTTAASTVKTAENTDIMTNLLSRLNKTMDSIDSGISELVLTTKINNSKSSLAMATAYDANSLN